MTLPKRSLQFETTAEVDARLEERHQELASLSVLVGGRQEHAQRFIAGDRLQQIAGPFERPLRWITLIAVAAVFGSLLYVVISGVLLAKLAAAIILGIIVWMLIWSLIFAMDHLR